jgi:hypothetical protein
LSRGPARRGLPKINVPRAGAKTCNGMAKALLKAEQSRRGSGLSGIEPGVSFAGARSQDPSRPAFSALFRWPRNGRRPYARLGTQRAAVAKLKWR